MKNNIKDMKEKFDNMEYFLFDNPFLTILSLIFFALIAVFAISFFSSHKKAELHNRLNGTEYTASDFFWAESQIK